MEQTSSLVRSLAEREENYITRVSGYALLAAEALGERALFYLMLASRKRQSAETYEPSAIHYAVSAWHFARKVKR